MISTEQESWIILAKGEGFWGIQIQRVEPEPEMLCTCVETGAVFSVEVAGTFDHSAHAAGKRIVRFYLVAGDERLERGFHMIPQLK